MKRHLAILLAILMVLGIAAVATAGTVESKGDTKITLGGDIRVRGEYMDNDNDFNKSIGTRRAFFDQRVRIYMDAQTSKNTTGRITLESGNEDNPTAENYIWGGAASDAAGIYRRGNARPTQMSVLEAWMQHKFDMGVTVKVGHMPLKLGRGLFFDHSKFGDDAILITYAPVKEFTLGLGYIKLSEGGVAFGRTANSTTTLTRINAPGLQDNITGATTTTTLTNTLVGDTRRATDADAYVLLGNYAVNKDMKFGFDITYVTENGNPLGTGTIGLTHPDLNLWNIGLNADLAFGPVSTYADVNFQTGKVKNFNRFNFAYHDNYSMSLRGWAMLIGMAYDMKPFKFRMEYAYGSGDDYYTDNVTIPNGSAFKGFITAQSNVVKYTYVYDYRTLGATGALNNGITNTNYIRLGVDYAATKDLMMKLDYFWLRASKKVALMANNTNIVPNSNELGHEIDWNINYKITPNLQYWVEGGYLFAGKAYDSIVAGVRKSADDAWAIRHGIMLSF